MSVLRPENAPEDLLDTDGDAIEQAAPHVERSPDSISDEVPEADRLEQDMLVGLDEDGYEHA